MSPAELTRYRSSRRRHILGVEAISCGLITLVLLVYSYAGTISVVIPSIYFLSEIGLIGCFAMLSETGFNDRCDDHHLTTPQISAHIAIHLVFLLLAPQIGFAFLSIIFLIF